MFPPSNFSPPSQPWSKAIEKALMDAEKRQSQLEPALAAAQRDSNSVLTEVSTNVNNYYNSTLAQYPAFQRTIRMWDVLGDGTKTVSMTAPSSTTQTGAETWFSICSYNLALPSAKTTVGVRLNSAQFGLVGPAAYYLRFRWVVGGTTEGLDNTRWMSRNTFNLGVYTMNSPSVVLTNVTNRYVHWTGASTSTLSVELQATIENIASRTSAVAAQSVTFNAYDTGGNPTYMDLMVTV